MVIEIFMLITVMVLMTITIFMVMMKVMMVCWWYNCVDNDDDDEDFVDGNDGEDIVIITMVMMFIVMIGFMLTMMRVKITNLMHFSSLVSGMNSLALFYSFVAYISFLTKKSSRSHFLPRQKLLKPCLQLTLETTSTRFCKTFYFVRRQDCALSSCYITLWQCRHLPSLSTFSKM